MKQKFRWRSRTAYRRGKVWKRYKERHAHHLLTGIFLIILFIVILLYLISANFISPEWGTFFLGYFIFLLILDFYWDIGVFFYRKRWRDWVRTANFGEFSRKDKGSQEFPHWYKYYQRRVVYLFLGLGYFLVWGIWGFLVTQKLEILLIIIALVVIIP